MRKLILLMTMSMLASPVFAFPFVVADPAPAGVTHCGRYEGGFYKIDDPIVSGACSVNLFFQAANTTVVYTLTHVIAGPPRLESPQSDSISITCGATPASCVVTGAPTKPTGLKFKAS
jgi:hypothetical protein